MSDFQRKNWSIDGGVASSSETAGPELLGRKDERQGLADLVRGVRAGHGGVVVLRGEAGIGKSALLEDLAVRAPDCCICRAVGVESEMELAYAGLQQLCGPMIDRLTDLPSPRRDALEKVFGLNTGWPPDRFLVGLAVLDLVGIVAQGQPVMWIVDDAQWLDRSSIQTIGFVSRRLLAERVAIVIAARDSGEERRARGTPGATTRGSQHRGCWHTVRFGCNCAHRSSRPGSDYRGDAGESARFAGATTELGRPRNW